MKKKPAVRVWIVGGEFEDGSKDWVPCGGLSFSRSMGRDQLREFRDANPDDKFRLRPYSATIRDLRQNLAQTEARVKQLEIGHDEWRTLAHRERDRVARLIEAAESALNYDSAEEAVPLLRKALEEAKR